MRVDVLRKFFYVIIWAFIELITDIARSLRYIKNMIRLKFKFSLSKKITKSYLMWFIAPQASTFLFSLHIVLFLKHDLKAFMLKGFQNFGPS